MSVYTTVALVILELVGNVTQPLSLPAWTPTLAIIILAMGFPIARQKYLEALILDGDTTEYYLRLAQVYAITGDQDKAYEYLRLYDKVVESNVILMSIRNNPLFEKMKNEPEFQQIVNAMEARYHAEHERVGRWLEENSMF